jgi:putative ATPase
VQPLAERMRPKTLAEYVGQKHLVGENGALRNTLRTKHLPSIILWGPPGVGKTTLANLLATELKRPFYVLSAISSGVKDVRETIEKAKNARFFNQPSPILFIDEIHRFSKSQQDSLLGAVEQGVVTLIGATTENPSFEVIGALLSRCQVYVLEPLTKEDMMELVAHSIKNDEILKTREILIEEETAMLRYAGGDARKLLNILELMVGICPEGEKVIIRDEEVKNALQSNIAAYDKGGELHYDIISAFIKSIRGSDPNAAVYWLARMIEGGEDLSFIARRLLILAAEDIGLANPNALLIANQCFDAVERIGYPESRIILSQAVIYLACSAKSNASYMAINEALELVRKTGNLPVPLHLRNAPTQLAKSLGYGKDYKYAHNYPGNFVEQEFMPKEISGTVLYKPGVNSAEDKFRQQMMRQWKDRYKY